MQTKQPSPNAKTRKQLALIAVLLIGLLVAIATQPESGDMATASDAEALTDLKISTVSMKPRSEASVAASAPSTKFTVIQDLPRLPLQTAQQNDPFQSRQRLVVRHASDVPVQQIKIQAIYGDHTGQRKSALMGAKILHTGEELGDHQTVTSVSPLGVTLTASKH